MREKLDYLTITVNEQMVMDLVMRVRRRLHTTFSLLITTVPMEADFNIHFILCRMILGHEFSQNL